MIWKLCCNGVEPERYMGVVYHTATEYPSDSRYLKPRGTKICTSGLNGNAQVTTSLAR